jgi:prevent-host-death family protein
MAKFVHVRDLKNQTTALLREVETGTTLIITRRGKPIATLKPFDTQDVQPARALYPTTIYAAFRQHIEARYPELKQRTPEEQRCDFARISSKINQALPFQSWQEMDRVAKGNRHDLTRQ